MKQIQVLLTIVMVLIFVAVQEGTAQNFFKTEPGMMKMLADTTFGTAAEVTFLPGAKTKMHTHSAEFIYALTDGTLLVHYEDGSTQTFSLKAGDSMIAPAEKPHWTENPGKKPLKFILVEFNEHPYMAMKMK